MLPLTPTPSRRLFPGAALLSFAIGLVAVAPAAPAGDAPRASPEEKSAPRERLNPDGIDGTLILCTDKVPEKTLDQFVGRAGKDKARLVVVAGEDTADDLAEAMKKHKPGSVEISVGDAKKAKLPEAFRQATGVWLGAGAAKRLTAGDGDAEAVKELRALLKRGGVIGASGTTASYLAYKSVDKLGGQVGGLNLMPGVLLDPWFHSGAGEDRLFEALDANPGCFGIGLGQGTTLVVRGRLMFVTGEGTATVCLAKSPAKPRRTLELAEKLPGDYTMLRRAAMARADAPFPPRDPPAPEVAKGSLVIVGGGVLPAEVTKKFIELAGGPDAHFVVLPTANPDPLPPNSGGGFLQRAGAKNVVVLPARTLEEVEDPKNLDVLKKADGVWFGGGRQWRFVDAYEGTKACELFHDVLRRGGVIGGGSAGATIQGYYLCRGSPLDNTEIECEGYERGLGFLPGVAIDQHFTQRNRFADMTGLMKTYPQLLGVGLDESTALVVRGSEAEVMGKGQAYFYDRNKPVVEGKPDYEAVKPGARYDLKGRKVLDPAGK